MPEVISSNKTIAKNTGFLYARMLFNLVVSLFTSRVNLQVLGIEDNGIYQVVGGVIAFFTFLNGSLAGATSRFIASELAHGITEKLKKTFGAALTVHIIAALLLLVLGETIGLWFVMNKLVIPESRMYAALVVYQFTIIGSVISLLQIPYNASIIAHEKMNAFAYIGMLDVILKLVACYLLYIIPFDKLITYGALILIFSALIQFIYFIYCKHHFEECIFRIERDGTIIRPMLSFSGWDMFSNFSLVAKNQGSNILLNMFFGVALNAACGFSNIVYGAISGFSKNFMMAVRPPLVKSYTIGDHSRMQQLMINGGKFSFCLMLLLSTPFIFESDFIIDLWLKTPPPFTSIFCTLQLITCMISVMYLPVLFGIQATGKNKYACICEGICFLSILPLSYILFEVGFNPLVPFIITIIVELIKSNAYLIFLKRNMPQYQVPLFFKLCVLPCIAIALLVLGITYSVFLFFGESSTIRFLCVCSVSTITVLYFTYFIALDESKKTIVKSIIINIFKRFKLSFKN